MDFLTNEKKINTPANIVTSLSKEDTKKVYDYLVILKKEINTADTEKLLSEFSQNETAYKQVVDAMPIDNSLKYETGFSLFKHKIPMWIFLIALMYFAVWSWKQNLSLIPLLGLICCLYMMAELSIWNWIYFTCWLVIGLCVYFMYGFWNSNLNEK